ncbi:MAG: hypothetical protein JWR77_1543, partial [Rhizorhabdus sp.]|nr:hypothetical protein [Rhizorhabdus sp.]
MFVGAVKADGLLAGAIGAGDAGRHAMPGALVFEALMIAAGAGDGGSAIKTEVSRSIAVLGSLRETVIHYTDGTSDIRM